MRPPYFDDGSFDNLAVTDGQPDTSRCAYDELDWAWLNRDSQVKHHGIAIAFLPSSPTTQPEMSALGHNQTFDQAEVGCDKEPRLVAA